MQWFLTRNGTCPGPGGGGVCKGGGVHRGREGQLLANSAHGPKILGDPQCAGQLQTMRPILPSKPVMPHLEKPRKEISSHRSFSGNLPIRSSSPLSQRQQQKSLKSPARCLRSELNLLECLPVLSIPHLPVPSLALRPHVKGKKKKQGFHCRLGPCWSPPQ